MAIENDTWRRRGSSASAASAVSVISLSTMKPKAQGLQSDPHEPYALSMSMDQPEETVIPNGQNYHHDLGKHANQIAPKGAGLFDRFEQYRNSLLRILTGNKRLTKAIVWAILLAAYISYLAYVLWLNFSSAQYLLWGSIAVVVLVIYFNAIKPALAKPANRLFTKTEQLLESKMQYVKLVLVFAYLLALGLFLGFDTASNPVRLRALAGIGLFLLVGIVLSKSPSRINWRIVASGTAFQFIFGLIVLRWDAGKDAFEWTGGFLQTVLGFANNGSAFVFSPGEKDHSMAFTVMPVLLFASFLIAILYHLGAMSWFVEKIGWLIYAGVGTTAAESISAAANIFLGQTEAPLTIKPYIPMLTNSELFAVMAGGYATISGSLLVTYASMGVDPKYLLAASVMNAPAALVMSKLLYPEVDKSRTTFADMKRDKGTAYNVLDAAMMAASTAVQAIGNILAMLICGVAFLALVDGLLGFLGSLANYPQLTLALISGYIFYPVAFLMGVDAHECQTVGQLLGYKTFLNEFVAYAEFKKITDSQPDFSEKGRIITTYALCGFANFSSVGIQLANFSIMAPDRKKDISSLVLGSLLAGFCANLLTASIAGLLIDA